MIKRGEEREQEGVYRGDGLMRGHGCWDDYRAEGEEKNERGGRVKETVIKYRRDRCADEGGGSNGRKKHQKREKSDTIAHNRSNFQRFRRQADSFSRYLMPTEAGLLLGDCFSPPAALRTFVRAPPRQKRPDPGYPIGIFEGKQQT